MYSTLNVARRLGLGTATFIPSYGLGHDTVADPDALVASAVERGIRYVDTAAAYGASERILGRHAPLLQSHSVRIATKVRARSDDRVDGALRRLGVPQVDTLLLHSARAEDLTNGVAVQPLLQAKHRQWARKTGASTYGVSAAELALEQPWCDVIQVEHSVLNPSVLRRIGPIRRPGQEVVVRSVLCKGLLTGRQTHFGGVSPRVARVLTELTRIAESWDYSLPELAIGFALATPGVDVVLVGVSSPAELDVAIRAAGRPLDERQWASLGEFDSHSEDWTHPERWVEVR